MRKLSIREIVLLAVLVVLLAYYFLVQGPIASKLENLEAQQEELDSELELYQGMVISKINMQNEIDRIMAQTGGNPESIKIYGNEADVVREFGQILGASTPFNISFVDYQENENNSNILSREIVISFAVSSYEAAVEKLQAIDNSSFRFLVKDMNIGRSTSERSTSYQVAVKTVYYEYAK